MERQLVKFEERFEQFKTIGDWIGGVYVPGSLVEVGDEKRLVQRSTLLGDDGVLVAFLVGAGLKQKLEGARVQEGDYIEIAYSGDVPTDKGSMKFFDLFLQVKAVPAAAVNGKEPEPEPVPSAVAAAQEAGHIVDADPAAEDPAGGLPF